MPTTEEFIAKIIQHPVFTIPNLTPGKRLMHLFSHEELINAIKFRYHTVERHFPRHDVEAAAAHHTDPFDPILINIFAIITSLNTNASIYHSDSIELLYQEIDQEMRTSPFHQEFQKIYLLFIAKPLSLPAQKHCIVMAALQLFYHAFFIQIYPPLNYHKNRDPAFWMAKQAVIPNFMFDILEKYPVIAAFLDKHLPAPLQILLPVINVLSGYIIANLVQLYAGGTYGESSSMWGHYSQGIKNWWNRAPAGERQPLIHEADRSLVQSLLPSCSLLQQCPGELLQSPKTMEQEKDLMWNYQLHFITLSNITTAIVKTTLIKSFKSGIGMYWPPLIPTIITVILGYYAGKYFYENYARLHYIGVPPPS